MQARSKSTVVVPVLEDMLDALGDDMIERIRQLPESTIEKLHVKGRAAVLRAL